MSLSPPLPNTSSQRCCRKTRDIASLSKRFFLINFLCSPFPILFPLLFWHALLMLISLPNTASSTLSSQISGIAIALKLKKHREFLRKMHLQNCLCELIVSRLWLGLITGIGQHRLPHSREAACFHLKWSCPQINPSQNRYKFLPNSRPSFGSLSSNKMPNSALLIC